VRVEHETIKPNGIKTIPRRGLEPAGYRQRCFLTIACGLEFLGYNGNSMDNSEREFDVIVWGATGFTGQLVAEYMAQTYGVNGDLKWAIAGRSVEKLSQVADDVAGLEATNLQQLIANSDDPDSINALVQKTRVICTTVGPYALYGDVIVAACAEFGTHCCDLTGEVQWMQRMIEKYQAVAESSGARIVHTCGFDSIPSDLGVLFLQQQMKEKHGEPATQIKYRVVSMDGGASGGTVASMMNMMEEAKVDPSISETLADPYALNPPNMPRGPDGGDQTGPEFDMDFKQWTAPFVMAGINTRVVRRSNALMDYVYGKEFRYSEAMLTGEGPGGYIKAAMVAGVSALMMITAAFSPTRSLLQKVAPAPGEGPSKEAREKGSFNIEFIGKCGEHRLKARVTGDKDPGYGATCKMLAESAVCLARDELEIGGGIWTPASAMGDKLIERLNEKAGMTFELI